MESELYKTSKHGHFEIGQFKILKIRTWLRGIGVKTGEITLIFKGINNPFLLFYSSQPRARSQV